MAKWYEKDTKNMTDKITIIKEKRAFIVDCAQLLILILILIKLGGLDAFIN